MNDFINAVIKQIFDKYGVAGVSLIIIGFIAIILGSGTRVDGIGPVPPESRPYFLVSGVSIVVIGLIFIISNIFKNRGTFTPTYTMDLLPLDPSISHIERIRRKINKINPKSFPFVLVGSVYLDILLYPIRTTSLKKYEWSDLHNVTVKLGGSCFLVGKYLWDLSKKKSHLISIVGGGNDFFTRKFNELIKKEKKNWIIGQLPKGDQHSRTALTFHLIQESEDFTTMFTDTGILGSLTWHRIREKTMNVLSMGGILYLSGILKTQLCDGIKDDLNSLAYNTIVCLDHGRLNPRMVDPHNDRISDLRAILNTGLIDVYFCTYGELCDFLGFGRSLSNELDGNKSIIQDQIESTLRSIAEAEHIHLPPITFIRGMMPGNTKVGYVIIDNTLYSLKGSGGTTTNKKAIGPKNAFNAACIYYLPLNGQRELSHDNLINHIIEVGNKAMEYWQEAPGF